MASNYPPGVTGNEPQIAGETHYEGCLLHEEARHDCAMSGQMMPYEVVPQPGRIGYKWEVVIPRGGSYGETVAVDYCPWCGEELPMIECRCADIAADMRDEAAEYRAEIKADHSEEAQL